MNQAGNIFLGLGTNESNRLANLHRAIELIIADKKNRVTATSSIYETEPIGYLQQAWFLNAVVEMKSSYHPFELLRFVKKTEECMGREHNFRWGPRLIDIDILLIGQLAIDDPVLTIPHPEMHRRKFVLLPLQEISPHLPHPILKQTITQLLEQCPDDKVVWHAQFSFNETRDAH
jgi:2-amino-4-hydroxy-6-hydroxymethyldihydropteridine diphosphokinase